MSSLSRIAVAAVVAFVPLAASAQPASPSAPMVGHGPSPTAAVRAYPIDMQLSTAVDHAAQVAGQLVQLRPVRVAHVVAGNLVELMDAREHGPYAFHIYYRPDRLLALIPAGTRAAKGDVLLVAGAVRTVRGAVTSGEVTGATAEKYAKEGNRALLVATQVTTIDGASLAGSR